MKSYLWKPNRDIFISSVLVYLILLFAFLPMAEAFFEAENNPNGLHRGYVGFVLQCGSEEDSFTEAEKIYNTFFKNAESFAIEYKLGSDVIYMVAHNYDLDLTLIDGCFIRDVDYEDNNNVMLIREDCINYCRKEDGRLFFEVDGSSYEVIGVFEKRKNRVNPQAKIIINGLADNVFGGGTYPNGYYEVDVPNGVMRELEKQYSIEYIASVKDKKLKTIVQETVEVLLFKPFFYWVILLFCVTVEWYLLYLWMEHSRRELLARRLCGAGRWQIVFEVLTRRIGMVFLMILSSSILLAANKRMYDGACLFFLGYIVYEVAAGGFVAANILRIIRTKSSGMR